jgi:hypothetical protein
MATSRGSSVPLPPRYDTNAWAVDDVVDAPACETDTVFPATVSVVVRALVEVFAVAETAAVPDPVAELPLVTVSQLAPLAAVHVQPLPVVTPMDPVLAPDGSDSVVLDRL